jgi:hypothetical protein
MIDIEDIIQTEKQQQHKLANAELLAFATVTQIAHEEAQSMLKKRFRFGSAACILLALIAAQILAFSQFSFSQISQQLGQRFGETIMLYPLAFTILNSVLIVVVLAARRWRLF